MRFGILARLIVSLAALSWFCGAFPSGREAVAQTESPVFEQPSEDVLEAGLGGGLRSPDRRDLAKRAKLGSHLSELVVAEGRARQNGVPLRGSNLKEWSPRLAALSSARLMRLDDGGRVQVYVRSASTAAAEVGALAAGGEMQRSDAETGTVQAWVPASRLDELAADQMVEGVRLPDYAVRNTGSVTSQGDVLLRAKLTRFDYIIGGAGVRVGVISDGIEGLAASQASGDLPGAVESSTCNMVPQSPTSAGAGAEGTAMLEIVHDLAPDAELWFGHFGYGFAGTSLDFQAAVNCLSANTDIVVDDIGFFNNGTYNGSSAVSVNTTNARNGVGPIRAYVNAVGNQALAHYQETYVDHNGAGSLANVHRFAGTAATTDVCALGANPADPLLLPPGGIVTVALQWNDGFGGSANDYDLFLVRNDTGMTVASSMNTQNGNDDPTEILAYVNDTGAERQFDIVIDRSSGIPRTFDMFILGDALLVGPPGCPFGPAVHNYNTSGSSVPNNSDAGGGVISAGTINANTNYAAPYSSQGPTNDLRIKPDITGMDAVFVTGNGGFPSTFYGTSAAGPHIAGIAALLLECRPEWKAAEPGDNALSDRSALRDALLNHAVDFGAAGVDNVYGSGQVEARNSAGAVCPPPPPKPLTNGNILVSGDFAKLFEYTRTGKMIQRRAVPHLAPNQTGSDYPRDIVLAQDAKVYVYNGTFDPYVSTYEPVSGTWTHNTAEGWTTQGYANAGGIGVFENYVFTTDMATYGAPIDELKGIVRFDTTDYTYQRFASDTDFSTYRPVSMDSSTPCQSLGTACLSSIQLPCFR